ncbi:ADAMTS-like protein 5 isoform X7 [Ahaetulla prasina]|uniref:ADAMTS-like protein 5 isoform X7 n=1 Tax=Ahaetulla prasina TaxID=499056 RepID=UPI002649E299|nr:ADAMTS-like protein 5 isoform X7 [Ahaetulla prasina]
MSPSLLGGLCSRGETMVHWNLTWKQSPSTDSNQPMGHGHTGAAGVLVPVPAGTASPSGSGGVSADSNPRRAEDLSDSDEVQRRQPVPPEGNRNDSANNPGPDGLEEELGGTNSPSDQLDSLPENELRRLPGEEPCRAEARQYRVCERKACPAGIVPFRAMQCTLYNSRPILGGQAQYQWVPFHGAANLCDLNCLAMGHNFYYSFGRVLDGTPCSPASPELCISGRCLRAGCDGVLGSEAQADACGVCGGKNESCVFIQEAFRVAVPASGFFGYRNVTQIPVGARQIRVIDNSRNYLALMEANQHYVLNGEWAVDQPGVFEAAGTQWHYTRTANGHETLEAAGSTSGDLFVMDPVGSATRREGNRNAFTTTATATSFSEHGSSRSVTSAPRHATTCRCSRRTATASRCARASTSGCPTPATAPTCWSGASTCSWRGTTSTSSKPSTGSCCRAAATPGPGRPAKTCCYATLPRVASPALPPERLHPRKGAARPRDC